MLHIQKFTFFPEAFAENTYVLWDDTKSCVVIDPGCYHQAERKQLIAFIEDKGLKLEKVLNTHCHIDHIMGNRLLVEHFKVPLVVPEKDVYNIKQSEIAAQLYNINLDPSPDPDEFIDEGDQVKFGDTVLEVMFTPGHSAGHVSFYYPEAHKLFSGDVIFQSSYGRTDLPGGNLKVLSDTIIKRIFTLPDETVIHPGHMGLTTVGQEKNTKPILQTL